MLMLIFEFCLVCLCCMSVISSLVVRNRLVVRLLIDGLICMGMCLGLFVMFMILLSFWMIMLYVW